MTLSNVDLFQISLRFSRLFPDPAVFEDQIHIARRYLEANGLPREKSRLIHQATDEIVIVNDSGGPALASGTAKYQFEGKTILAEYMSNASLRLEYFDFGTGLTPDDHSRLWKRGRFAPLSFELREFKHQARTLNIPEVSGLYKILRERTSPNSLSTIELENVPGNLFNPVLSYLGDELRSAATSDGLEVEVYAAKDISASERVALEKRLARESTKNTVFIILNQSSRATQSST